MQKLSYRILFRPEPEGGYTVFVPTFPGCITYGETLEEARTMAIDAIKLYLKSLKKHHEKIPDDSDLLEGTLNIRYAQNPLLYTKQNHSIVGTKRLCHRFNGPFRTEIRLHGFEFRSFYRRE